MDVIAEVESFTYLIPVPWYVKVGVVVLVVTILAFAKNLLKKGRKK